MSCILNLASHRKYVKNEKCSHNSIKRRIEYRGKKLLNIQIFTEDTYEEGIMDDNHFLKVRINTENLETQLQHPDGLCVIVLKHTGLLQSYIIMYVLETGITYLSVFSECLLQCVIIFIRILLKNQKDC
jgi:hypothetical protein